MLFFMRMRTFYENHVVHRDLKLENVLLTRDLESKVADFDHSKFFSSKLFILQEKSERMHLYDALEMFKGERINHSGNVYFFDVLFNAALCEHNSFAKGNLLIYFCL